MRPSLRQRSTSLSRNGFPAARYHSSQALSRHLFDTCESKLGSRCRSLFGLLICTDGISFPGLQKSQSARQIILQHARYTNFATAEQLLGAIKYEFAASCVPNLAEFNKDTPVVPSQNINNTNAISVVTLRSALMELVERLLKA